MPDLLLRMSPGSIWSLSVIRLPACPFHAPWFCQCTLQSSYNLDSKDNAHSVALTLSVIKAKVDNYKYPEAVSLKLLTARRKVLSDTLLLFTSSLGNMSNRESESRFVSTGGNLALCPFAGAEYRVYHISDTARHHTTKWNTIRIPELLVWK